MVSFSCENCGDILTKKKLDQHRNRCRGATFTCIDCMVYFPGLQYRAHTACISEEQKYQGALYKNKNKKQKGANNHNRPIPPPVPEVPEDDMVPAQAYVEDVPEDDPFVIGDDGDSPPETLPEAPTPPSAVPEPHTINVFDFLVDGEVSHVDFTPGKDESQLVHYDYENDGYVDPDGYMVDDDNEALVQYGTGPVPSAEAYNTPIEKQLKKKSDKSEPKKDKKRKRLHVEINDQVMTDAPPVLHTSLTGDISHMQFPPSPEFSGDSADAPASPTKKTKHTRNKSTSSNKSKNRNRSESLSSSLLALVSGNTVKPKKRKVSKKKSTPSTGTRHRRNSDEKPTTKLIEYNPSSSRPGSRDSESNHNHNNQMVLYHPRADLFLSMVTKGPESERGCSVNKALKRFHRERSASREGRPNKSTDEKELWRSLRMRRNDRGEIVLFSLDDEE